MSIEILFIRLNNINLKLLLIIFLNKIELLSLLGPLLLDNLCPSLILNTHYNNNHQSH